MRTSLHCILIAAGAALMLGSLAPPLRADILYVSADNDIEKFTSGGVRSVFATSGLHGPFGSPLIVPAISTRQTQTTRLRSSPQPEPVLVSSRAAG